MKETTKKIFCSTCGNLMDVGTTCEVCGWSEQVDVTKTEFDLDEFSKYLDELDKKREMDISKFDRIVKGVARKYNSIYVDREDLEQDLWLMVVEMANKAGGIDNLDEKFVARCCWNRAVDKYRYDRRRRDSKVGEIDWYTGEADEDDTGKNFKPGKCFVNASDVLLIKGVIDLFEKGSRERKYVVSKLYADGLIEAWMCDNSLTEDELVIPSDNTEESFLKEILGYGSKYPGSWGRKKHLIYEAVMRYLTGE